MSTTPEHPSDEVVKQPAASPQKVLAWVVVIIAVALAAYLVAPWVLPVRIVDGPYVQNATGDAISLIWYTSKPAACRVEIQVAGEVRTLAATADGRRHRARVTDLIPGAAYPYAIMSGGRVLSEGLRCRTNRPPGQPFSFIVFGDSGKGSQAQYELAAQMQALHPPAEFLLHTGDVVYPDGARARYNYRLFTPYRRLMSEIVLWPCVGNHDVEDDGTAPAYEEVFETPANGPPGLRPDHNYWFDYAAARIVVLDSNLEEAVLAEQVAPWLEEVLADDTPRWKFVAFHHPPFTGGKYEPDARIRTHLVPIMEAADVDIVFNGHDHNYQRIAPLRAGEIVDRSVGVTYVITGAGGAALYQPRGADVPYVEKSDFDQHSFTQVSVTGDRITLRQISRRGEAIDEVSWEKATVATQPATQPASP